MMRYAGMYADVVNNSWTATACESELNAAIDDVVSGNLSGARRGVYGSPVLFATGNKAGGWRKFSVDVSAGSHTFRWRFVKDASNSEGHDKVWLDDIDWGEDDITDFEDDTIGVMPGGFGLSGHAVWSVVSDGIHARNRIGNSVQSGVIGNDQHTDLISTREVGAGEVSFWVWVSCEAKNSATYRDRFEFYVDDILEIQSAPGQYDQHVDSVGYPASNADTIAVGASNDGVWSGADERSHYSQFGHELDVVAPSSGGEESITTTDNTDADGYNDGTGDDLSNLDYTNTFGGTSSATPLVSGVVASLLSYRSMLTVEEVRTILHHSAEKIGPYSYNGGRNDYYGYGKVSFPYAVGQVWVDFLQTGSQTGSPSHGFNSVGVAAQTVPAGGLMVIKAGTTSEKPILDRKMTVRSTGGNVVIGYP